MNIFDSTIIELRASGTPNKTKIGTSTELPTSVQAELTISSYIKLTTESLLHYEGYYSSYICDRILENSRCWECLDDIVNVVEQSAALNHAQLVGTHNKHVIVPTYNWVTFFATHFKKISNITKYHHFTASTNKKGIIISKIFSDSTEIESALLKDDSWNPTIHEMPPIVEPQGMSAERQWYLYDKI